MSSLDILVRLARNAVDERRVELAGIVDARAAAAQALRAHDARAADEAALAAASLEAAARYASWLRVAAQRRRELDSRLAALALAEQEAHAALCAAVAAFKRLETAAANAAAAAAREAARRAAASADELALLRRVA